MCATRGNRSSGLEPEAFAALHNSVKRGDIIGVEGFPGKSKMGELSIFPRRFVVLSPCLHMPPTVRSGLKDQASALEMQGLSDKPSGQRFWQLLCLFERCTQRNAMTSNFLHVPAP